MNRRDFFLGAVAVTVVGASPAAQSSALKIGDVITIDGVAGRYRVVSVAEGSANLRLVPGSIDWHAK